MANATGGAEPAEEVLRLFRTAAVEAGDAILGHFGPDCRRALKADLSPVTEADHAAEAIILAHLRRALPEVPVVAEEAMAAGRGPAAIGNRLVLVDPLDGTREFIAGRGEFTVNIALVVDGRPTVGIVFAPALGELFAGSPVGAFKAVRDPGGGFSADAAIAVRKAPPHAVALASRSHRTAETERFLAGLDLDAVLAMGSSLKFCRLAEGAADVYPCFGRTMEWDTAAGQAVLAAAGGRVRQAGGGDLLYAKRGRAAEADFVNPFFVATGAATVAF